MSLSSDSDALQSPFMRALRGEVVRPLPVWLMRQAGRYLPEYRAVRAEAGSFLDLCFSPELAAEVTVQPVRRFGMDAAILFSDILLPALCLGQELSYEEDVGPRVTPALIDLSPVEFDELLAHEPDQSRLNGVSDAVTASRERLPAEIPLIGFCGAPWTVATYLVAGRAEAAQIGVRRFAKEEPVRISRLIERLITVSTTYLCDQVAAGVNALQIFDSWSGVLTPREYRKWCLDPVRKIVEQVRAACPSVPIIYFPKGSSIHLAETIETVRPDGLGLDWTTDLRQAASIVGERSVLQGNLDPVALLQGGIALDTEVRNILSDVGDRAHIFNLGHGVDRATPISHVHRAISIIRTRKT